MVGQLYLIPNIIAEGTQAQVLPAQVAAVVERLDYFLVEDLRTARRFIKLVCPGKNIEQLTLVLLNKDSEAHEVERAMQPVMQGRNAGVLSEAGCPGIADPGAEAVKFAHKAGVKVQPLVGPSSILLALMASGFNGQSFAFSGYLPIEKKDRLAALKALERKAQSERQTQIFMETPYRNNKLLDDLVVALAPATLLCIAADVTGEHEFIKTLPIASWKKQLPDLHKKPVIYLLYTNH